MWPRGLSDAPCVWVSGADRACLVRSDYKSRRVRARRWDPAIHKEVQELFSVIDVDVDHKIRRDDYIAFLHKVYIALIGSPRSKEEEEAVEEADWAADSEGKGYIDLRRFFRAMFELADVWTLHPSRDEYVYSVLLLILSMGAQ